ncbi:MAG: GerW family sporulation protein [Clostridia bacterium]|nr:GerW family sporulation protein [Clostridia bacterium]
MAEHPIQGLMDTAMSNIKAMVDVNTIVGNAVTTPDNTVIIPISTVSFGFAAGGSEVSGKKSNIVEGATQPLFGGGAGGGANVKPVAFLVVGNGNVRLLPITNSSSPVDKIIDLMPEMVDKVNGAVSSLKNKKKKDDTPEDAE